MFPFSSRFIFTICLLTTQHSNRFHNTLLWIENNLQVRLSEGNKRQLNIYQIAPLWFDTLISKLATNILCTCRHH
jgi:hypothetical protein